MNQDLIFNYEFLKKIDNEVKLFYSNKSKIVEYGKKNSFNRLYKKITIKKIEDSYVEMFRLAHELVHYYQDKLNIQYEELENDIYDKTSKSYRFFLPVEHDAYFGAVLYFYFILEMPSTDIIYNLRESGMPCGYFRSLMSNLTIETIVENPNIISINLEFNSFDKSLFSVDTSKKIISFKNKDNNDIAHFSIRNQKHLWYGFYNGKSWSDFIIPYFFINGTNFTLNIKSEGRDNGYLLPLKNYIQSQYNNKNKDYVGLIQNIVKEENYETVIKRGSYSIKGKTYDL